jgi:hypothetical protein
LYSICSGSRYSLDETDDLGTDGIQLIQRQRTAVLNEYPTGELLQLYAVIPFFREILKGVYDGPDDREFSSLNPAVLHILENR